MTDLTLADVSDHDKDNVIHDNNIIPGVDTSSGGQKVMLGQQCLAKLNSTQTYKTSGRNHHQRFNVSNINVVL